MVVFKSVAAARPRLTAELPCPPRGSSAAGDHPPDPPFFASSFFFRVFTAFSATTPR
jgi:hypothetical protein